jgi:hypothetical protein
MAKKQSTSTPAIKETPNKYLTGAIRGAWRKRDSKKATAPLVCGESTGINGLDAVRHRRGSGNLNNFL